MGPAWARPWANTRPPAPPVQRPPARGRQRRARAARRRCRARWPRTAVWPALCRALVPQCSAQSHAHSGARNSHGRSASALGLHLGGQSTLDDAPHTQLSLSLLTPFLSLSLHRSSDPAFQARMHAGTNAHTHTREYSGPPAHSQGEYTHKREILTGSGPPACSQNECHRKDTGPTRGCSAESR